MILQISDDIFNRQRYKARESSYYASKRRLKTSSQDYMSEEKSFL